jgi:hypothetical protein
MRGSVAAGERPPVETDALDGHLETVGADEAFGDRVRP